ncbi:MAG: hypothetical protein ISQ13_03290 [Candidatus Margulisbacteria bacterium]|nr:hypothetical protein [Candidatus Margulisiibacteriota bacterium]
MFIDLFEEQEENPDEYISFIVFEPASLRIPDNDLLFMGDEVSKLFKKVVSSNHFESNIQDQTLMNRLQRIEMMVDLLKSNNGLIMTKFLNKIWRRYSFFSNLGELFISVKDMKRLAPDFKFNEQMVLDRVIETDDTPDDDSSDDDNDNDSSDDSDDSNTSENKATTSSKETN